MPVMEKHSERMKKFKNKGKDTAVSTPLCHTLLTMVEPAGGLLLGRSWWEGF